MLHTAVEYNSVLCFLFLRSDSYIIIYFIQHNSTYRLMVDWEVAEYSGE